MLDEKGNGSVKHVLGGIQWVLSLRERWNVRVLNVSIGMFPDARQKEQEALLRGVEMAWDEGIVVVAAAGNNGPGEMSITNPGISPRIITVGAIREQVRQRHYSGIGPTRDCVMKPEILAPGQRVVSCKNAPQGYVIKSGSSMATPVVSGVIALLLEKRPELSPMEVKMELYDKSVDLGLDKRRQGWGAISARKLLN